MVPFGLYVHSPFCPQRCPYCCFAVVTGRDHLQARYIEAVCAELEMIGSSETSTAFDSVFFGGGTPSRVHPSLLGSVLETARRLFGFTSDAEITVEANPGSTDAAAYDGLHALGFNRISIGAQSFVDDSLKRLGRIHTAEDVGSAFARARDAGFDNINLDLIFSVPGVDDDSWHRSLEAVIALRPEHISTYSLTIEPETPFDSKLNAGQLRLRPEDESAEEYEQAMRLLSTAGYEHYEVSNFCLPGRRCHHNWACWTGGEYLGAGVSAHSHTHGSRRWNERDLTTYLESVEAGRLPLAGEEQLSPSGARQERLWLGLRTVEGVELSPHELTTLAADGRTQAMLGAGYLEFECSQLRLTSSGFAIADAVSVDVARILEQA
jgi:oxygen-independent coproporphyrinogen-3 oxidase